VTKTRGWHILSMADSFFGIFHRIAKDFSKTLFKIFAVCYNKMYIWTYERETPLVLLHPEP